MLSLNLIYFFLFTLFVHFLVVAMNEDLGEMKQTKRRKVSLLLGLVGVVTIAVTVSSTILFMPKEHPQSPSD